MHEEGITVAQACQRLGVSERTLRRLLRRPEHQAMVQAVNRRVGGRERQVVLLSPALVSSLQQRFAEEETSTGEAGGKEQAAGGNPTYFAYERLLAEKDARIAELTDALAHERAQRERLTPQTGNRHGGETGRSQSLWKRLLGLR